MFVNSVKQCNLKIALHGAGCTGYPYCHHYLILDVCFAAVMLFLMCVICVFFQVVSAVQPKGIKVSNNQNAGKENKTEKVFIPFNAIPKFY